MSNSTEVHYTITVWNTFNGDVEKRLWDASEEDLDDLHEQYEGEPGIEISIDREWEETVNE